MSDPSAFDLLYERHQETVFRYAASRVGPVASEDLTADTFLIAFDIRSRFDPTLGSDALPWLLGIATRRLGQYRDSERRWLRGRSAATLAGSELLEEWESTAERLDAGRLVPELVAALANLSRRERDPLLLHALGGLSYEEVATVLDTPIGTVRSRISRARTRLAGLLDETAVTL